MQEGFLADQDAPATAGNRDLRYDIRLGEFRLSTTSYAKIRCDMDFGLYPFDTQRCTFAVIPMLSIDYQEKKIIRYPLGTKVTRRIFSGIPHYTRYHK